MCVDAKDLTVYVNEWQLNPFASQPTNSHDGRWRDKQAVVNVITEYRFYTGRQYDDYVCVDCT